MRPTNFEKAATGGAAVAVEAVAGAADLGLATFVSEEKTKSDRPDLGSGEFTLSCSACSHASPVATLVKSCQHIRACTATATACQTCKTSVFALRVVCVGHEGPRPTVLG